MAAASAGRKVTQARRARSAFLWALGVFVCGQLALIGVMERWLPQFRDPAYGKKLNLLRARLAESPDRPLLLTLGSSRMFQGLEAGRLNGIPAADGRPFVAFNFGMNAAGPAREWLYLQRLLEAGIRPDMVLVEMMPPLFNEPGPDRLAEEQWMFSQAMGLSDVLTLRHFHSKPRRMYRDWFRSRLLPGHSLRKYILASVSASWVPPDPFLNGLKSMDAFGWQPIGSDDFPQAERRLLTEAARVQYAKAVRDFRIGPRQRQAQINLLELAQRNGIAVVLVLMPEASVFRNWYTPEMEVVVAEFLAEMSRTHGTALIDARTWVPDSGFYDSHHMLRPAAAAFSARLADEVLRRREELLRLHEAPDLQLVGVQEQ